ncbi:hypothetical protein BDA99DRAFT_529144 [Phascolomyces articulosus]|uniref:HMG box domain-containing protein n=1 Tax=Phascolomyces articulosus TaxID=60185 RepID=A0AAD5JLW7_9FUNG|nr:hypothetical protein BDA99DRAFT_529144 [Phascolomyces articulosus]
MESQDEQLAFDINNQGHQEVKNFFQQCRLLQYLEVFINEGFESLPALFEVTEEDMIAMGVKRGHRRLIQRDIVTVRGMTFHVSSPQQHHNNTANNNHCNQNHPFQTSMKFYHQHPEGDCHSHYYPQQHRHHSPPSSVNVSTISSPTSIETTLSPTDSSSSPSTRSNSNNALSSSSDNGNTNKNNNTVIIQHQVKRKYRKKPKPDQNAPIKPSSAYVMFSNFIRAEMKHQNKSFTEISKIIGEQWKNLSTEKKHDYELTAMRAKDAYLIEIQHYARTQEYRNYQKYLKTFKEKQAVSHQSNLREKNRRRALNRLDSPSSDSIGDSSSNSMEHLDSGNQTATDTSESSSSSGNGTHPMRTDPQEQVFLLKLPRPQTASTCTERLG